MGFKYDALVDSSETLKRQHSALKNRFDEKHQRVITAEKQAREWQLQVNGLRNEKEDWMECLFNEQLSSSRASGIVLQQDSALKELALKLLKRNDQLQDLEQAKTSIEERLLTSEARSADLLSQTRGLSKDKTKLEKELASAKEDVDWYETQTLAQQDTIHRLRRDLGLARTSERQSRDGAISQGNDLQCLREEFQTKFETLKADYEKNLAALEEQKDAEIRELDEMHEERYSNCEEATRMKMQQVKQMIDSNDTAVEEALERQMEQVYEQLHARDEQWMERIQELQASNEELCQQLEAVEQLQTSNEELRQELGEVQEFFDKMVEEEVVKRLREEGACPAAESDVVTNLEQHIYELEAQLEAERQEHQDRLTAAIQEGWQMTSDEKVTEILEEHNRIQALLEEACAERDALAEEQHKYQEYCAIQLDNFEECQQKLAELQEAYDKVLAAQDATLEANHEHRRNLEMARQVEILVDQVFDLEEELKVAKAAQEEAEMVVCAPINRGDKLRTAEAPRAQAAATLRPKKQHDEGNLHVDKGQERPEGAKNVSLGLSLCVPPSDVSRNQTDMSALCVIR